LNENSSQRPNNCWKGAGGGEIAQVSGQGGVEFLLCGIDSGTTTGVEEGLYCMEITQYHEFLLSNVGISCDAKILTDLNVWIAHHTGVTVNSSPHEWGMQNKRKDNSGITVGNGVTEKTSVTGDITGIICDKYGTQLQETVLTEVTLLSNGQFNLFSVRQMTNKVGWLLHGHKEKLWREKNGNKVVFDIVVQTPKGAVYCMYFKCTAQNAEISGVMVEKKMTMNRAHDLFVHDGTERVIRLMAKARNIE
jgi:hypothetical protein